jgi:hypothetical protein
MEPVSRKTTYRRDGAPANGIPVGGKVPGSANGMELGRAGRGSDRRAANTGMHAKRTSGRVKRIARVCLQHWAVAQVTD